MKSFICFRILFLGCCFLGYSQHDLRVSIEQVPNDKGQVVIGLFNSSDGFLKQVYKGSYVAIENGKASYQFTNIPTGTYAISVYHDKNKNKKLDTNFLGIPKENYACSNAARGFMGPPRWQDAQFEVKSNLEISIRF